VSFDRKTESTAELLAERDARSTEIDALWPKVRALGIEPRQFPDRS
jgi:hypothetical protein